MKQRVCILFAGVPGSSKTPIANYLSTRLNVPVHCNDAIRTEVKEDLLFFDIPECERRQRARLDAVIASGISFIFDASVDRTWAESQQRLQPQAAWQ